jgi:hypothetical protein
VLVATQASAGADSGSSEAATLRLQLNTLIAVIGELSTKCAPSHTERAGLAFLATELAAEKAARASAEAQLNAARSIIASLPVDQGKLSATETELEAAQSRVAVAARVVQLIDAHDGRQVTKMARAATEQAVAAADKMCASAETELAPEQTKRSDTVSGNSAARNAAEAARRAFAASVAKMIKRRMAEI